jgi:hypothetical protein
VFNEAFRSALFEPLPCPVCGKTPQCRCHVGREKREAQRLAHAKDVLGPYLTAEPAPVPADPDDETMQTAVSKQWAKDWDSPEDAAYDALAPTDFYVCPVCDTVCNEGPCPQCPDPDEREDH